MKYVSAFLVVFALFTAGIAKAQSASKLNGQSYTYMMKNADGSGEEIIDVVTFQNNSMTSSHLGTRGYTSNTVVEKDAGTSTNFEVTMASKTEGTRVYRGQLQGDAIEGTITVTDKQGVQTTMLFRGMTTETWNTVQEQKRKAREELMKKQNSH